MQSHQVDFEKTIVEERRDIESRVLANAKENAQRQKIELEAEKIEAIKISEDELASQVQDLSSRNGQLCDQLEARDNEFRSTLATLEEMRFALSTVNQASMQATADLERRYAGMCEQLLKRNKEVKALEEKLAGKENIENRVVVHAEERAEEFTVRTKVMQSGSAKDEKVSRGVESSSSSDAVEGLPSISEISLRLPHDDDGNLSMNSSPRYEIGTNKGTNDSSNNNNHNSNNNNNNSNNNNNNGNNNLNSNGNSGLPNVPKNPFEEDTIKKLKDMLLLRDDKLSKLVREFDAVKRDYQSEKDAHSETSDDFEMRLAVLCDQLEDTKNQLHATKEELGDRKLGREVDYRGEVRGGSGGIGIGGGLREEKSSDSIDSIKSHLFPNHHGNEDTTMNDNSDTTERERELSREKQVMVHTILELEKSNASLTRIGKDLNKKVHSLTPVKKEKDEGVEKEGKDSVLVGEENERLKQSVRTIEVELEVEKKKLKQEIETKMELNTSITNLQNMNSKQIEEIKELNIKIIKLINSAVTTTSVGGACNISGKSGNSYPFSLGFQDERSENRNNTSWNNSNVDDDISLVTRSQKTDITINSVVYDSANNNDKNNIEYVTESVEVLVPRSGADYFASQKKRDTDFLLIPFDRVNEMAPTDVLKLLISYKLEHASISTELDDAKNELNRIKRINIMNATHAPGIRSLESSSSGRVSTPHFSHNLRLSTNKNNHTAHHNQNNHSSSHTTPNSKYAERNKNEKEKKLSSSSISENASRFSSDMFKSTANLLRMKSKSRGGGSVVGSVAESFTTSLWGGSVKDTGEQWEGSDSSSVYNNSSHGGSICDSHRKYVENM